MPLPHNGPCPNSFSLGVQVKQILQGRYEIIGLIGEGGMGEVYKAHDVRLHNRICVVKRLRNDFYKDEDRQKAQVFFQREIAVLSQLQHPNIVHILDYFIEASDYYLVMEYIDGPGNLYNILQERGQPFDEEQVLNWAVEICDVLEYLHGQHPAIIYRDLKPSNIMIDTKMRVKLVDFGIARRFEDNVENTHVVSGGYSPPEQYWGAAHPQSDIYSLGATMYFLLTGKDPEALTTSSAKNINPLVSDYTDSLIQKATAQDPAQRFLNAQEVRESILKRDYIEAPETPRSRIGEVVAAIVLFIICALIYLGPSWFWPSEEKAKNLENNTNQKAIDENQIQKITNDTKYNPQAAAQVIDESKITDPEGMN
jgi:serine/threonine-protein kinase